MNCCCCFCFCCYHSYNYYRKLVDTSGRLFKTRDTTQLPGMLSAYSSRKMSPFLKFALVPMELPCPKLHTQSSLNPVTCWWRWTKTQIPCFNVRHLWNAILCHIIPWDQLSLSCNYIVDQPLALTNAASLIPLKVGYLRPLPNIPLVLKIPP